MTNPDDPQRWTPASPQGDAGGSQPPQQPATGPFVSYDASAFEDDGTRTDNQSVAPPSGPVTAQPDPYGPVSGGYPAAGYPDQGYSPELAYQPEQGYQPEQAYGVSPGYQPAPSGFPAGSGAIPVPPPYGAGGTPAPGKRSNKPLLLALGGVVLVGVLVVGYFVLFRFSGIQNAKGEISNAGSFLSQTKSQWEDELPEDGIEVSPKASCYYVINSRDEVTNQIACGPSRRASTPEGAVWDMFHFSVNGSGDSQNATDLVATDTSQPAPKSASLVTLDGDAPEDDGLGLKEPPLPKAPEGAVYQQADFEVSDKSLGQAVALPSAATLIGPQAQVTVTGIQGATAATIDGKLMAPAEGEKFTVVSVTGGTSPIDQTADNTLEFTIDGKSVGTGVDPGSLGEDRYLVSVPDGADATVDLVSSGHRQSINLADGTRIEDKNAAMYYTDKPEINVPLSTTVSLPETPSSVEGQSFSLTMAFTAGWLYPYDAELGWAPDGQVWMQLDFKDSGTSHAESSPYTGYFLDCMPTTVDAGGIMHTCPGTLVDKPMLIASVPTGQTSFTVNVAAKITTTGDGVADGTVTFAPVPTTFSLA